MRDALLAEVEDHFRHWADHLGVGFWWLHVGFMDEEQEKDNPDSSMIVKLHRDQYRRAYVYVRRDQSEREFPLEMSVLHEVCHVYFSGIDDLANSTAPTYSQAWDRQMETEADDLAMVLWKLHERTDCRIGRPVEMVPAEELLSTVWNGAAPRGRIV